MFSGMRARRAVTRLRAGTQWRTPVLQGLTPEHVCHAERVMTEEKTYNFATRSLNLQPRRSRSDDCGGERWRLRAWAACTKKAGPRRGWRRPAFRGADDQNGNVVVDPDGSGRRGGLARGLGLGLWRVTAVGAVGLVEELDATARGEQDLGGEPVGFLTVLAPAPRLQLAGHVDEPTLPGVLLQHVHESGLERDHPVPLGALLAVAGVAIDVAFVGGDGHVGHPSAAGQVVDGDVGAEAADDFCAIQTKHCKSPWYWLMTRNEPATDSRESLPDSSFPGPARTLRPTERTAKQQPGGSRERAGRSRRAAIRALARVVPRRAPDRSPGRRRRGRCRWCVEIERHGVRADMGKEIH